MSKPPIVHHVFFWLKDPHNSQDRDKLIEGLKTLENIESVQELHIGIPAGTEDRSVIDNSWQVSELMFFNDLEGQAAYQTHPIHQNFVKNYGHLWTRVVVYDASTI